MTQVRDDVLSAIHEADQHLRQRVHRNSWHEPASGEVYINFVDLMEFLNLAHDGGVDHDARSALEQLFKGLKGDDAFQKRVTAILFEEGRGLAQVRDYTWMTKYLREQFPNPTRLLVHGHGGSKVHEASLASFEAGADGIWAAFIPAAAQNGHNSVFGFLDDLRQHGNERAKRHFNLSLGIPVAKLLHYLNFNTVKIPEDCPIYGANNAYARKVHTDFDFTAAKAWHGRAQNEYNQLHQDQAKFLEDILTQAKQLSLRATECSRPQGPGFAYRIAPLVSDAMTVGSRVFGDRLVVERRVGSCNMSEQDLKRQLGSALQAVFHSVMVADIRVNFDCSENLAVAQQLIERNKLPDCLFFIYDRVHLQPNLRRKGEEKALYQESQRGAQWKPIGSVGYFIGHPFVTPCIDLWGNVAVR